MSYIFGVVDVYVALISREKRIEVVHANKPNASFVAVKHKQGKTINMLNKSVASQKLKVEIVRIENHTKRYPFNKFNQICIFFVALGANMSPFSLPPSTACMVSHRFATATISTSTFTNHFNNSISLHHHFVILHAGICFHRPNEIPLILYPLESLFTSF